VALVLLLAACGTLRAQQGDKTEGATPSHSSNDAYTLHAAAHLVVLDVSVFDWKGLPVTGLTKDDFHLLEDGHEQNIRHFEEHAPIDPEVARQRLAEVANKLPANTFTNFKPIPTPPAVNVVVIDEATTEPNLQYGFYQDLAIYFKTVPPGTPFIIFRLDKKLQMVQGLTMDPAVELAAVEPIRTKHLSLPNRSFVVNRQIVGSAVDQLTSYLAGIPGRKTLLWFTAQLGIDLSSTGEHGDPIEQDLFCKWTDQLKQNRIDAYRLGAGFHEDKVYSGLGCRASRDSGNSIATVVNNAAHYYTISYTPTNANWDGHYRKVKLNLNGKAASSTKGGGVDYREGYYAREGDGSVRREETVEPAPNTESRAMQSAMGMGSPESDDLVFEASMSPSVEVRKDSAGAAAPTGNYLSAELRQQGYREYAVRYLVRANQFKLLASPDQSSYAAGLEVVAVLYDALGKPVNTKKSQLSAGFDSLNDPRIQSASVTADLKIQVPTQGEYFLRLGVRDVATDKVGALEIPVSSIHAETVPAAGSDSKP
jgi:VWFA-related protein